MDQALQLPCDRAMYYLLARQKKAQYLSHFQRLSTPANRK
jgi:hypothetical protein